MSRTKSRVRIGSWAVLLTAAAVLAPARADAQWIAMPGMGPSGSGYPFYGFSWPVPAIGYAPWVGFMGPGGYTGWAGGASPYGIGWSPYYSSYGRAFNRYLGANMMASRYNLNTAEAATAYQAANLFHQEALGTMLDNYGGRKYASPSYDIRTGAPASVVPYSLGNGPGPGERERHPGVAIGGRQDVVGQPDGDAAGGGGTLPFNRLIGRDGEVLWPLGAPTKGDLGTKKKAADEAIQGVLQDARRGRRVPARRVVEARDKLAAYVNPAADAIRKHNEKDVAGFADYVQSLDAGLRSLAETRGTGRAGRAPDIDPPNRPKTGGDVLEKSLEKEAESAPRERDR